jgi:hypothetical protein
MKKQLFQELFRVAKERSPSSTRNGICKYLENTFTEKDGDSFNRETFIRYYKKYIENKDIAYNPNGDLLNRCSEYLGYDSYEDYVMKKKSSSEISQSTKTYSANSNSLLIFKKNKKTIIIINLIMVLALAFFIYKDLAPKSQEKWMIWKENQYVAVEFSATKYYKGLLEPYDQKALETFKKIENPDCNTRYFNTNGEPVLWYYKVRKGHLELYTSPGLHPTNGKTLKAITRYMIQTHICPTY